MDDFTKDELELINTALSVYEKRIYGNQSPTRFTPLLKIIGRLIDNYCEHAGAVGSSSIITLPEQVDIAYEITLFPTNNTWTIKVPTYEPICKGVISE